jgi:hypothetical protein
MVECHGDMEGSARTKAIRQEFERFQCPPLIRRPFQILLANQDSLEPLQRSRYDAYPVSASQKGVRLNSISPFDRLSNRLDLGFRNGCHFTVDTQNGNDPRGGHYVEPPILYSPQKQVAGEQRKRELHGAVLPSASRVVKREKDFEPLGGEKLGNDLLVLMSCVNRAPRPARTRLLRAC